MKYLHYLILFVIIIAFVGCNKGTEPQDKPNNGITQYGTPFANVPDTKDIIMYEANMRIFSPGYNFQGIINRIDSIKALNVNVIWLMPIFPIGQVNSVNSPYCVKNYKEVNPEFGTLQDLRNLVDIAHSKNIAIVLDWVANHTSWDNPWIANKAWYTQDGNGNIISPAGQNWADVADLNYDNTEMRLTMIDAMKYWIYEANVDGFRCDAADLVPFSFWKQAIDSLKSITTHKLILLAEGKRADHFTAGFKLNYGWDFYGVLKNIFQNPATAIAGLFNAHLIEYQSLPSDCAKLRFTTNHDESAWDKTPIQLFNGKKGAMAASVAAIFMGGAPLIYSSQEVGVSTTVPFFTNTAISWTANNDMFKEYQKLLGFYSSSIAAKNDQLQTFYDTDILVFKKYTSTQEVLVFVNVRNSAQSFTLPEALKSNDWVNALTGISTPLTSLVSLQPYEYLIVTK